MKKKILIPTLIIGTLLTGSLAVAAPNFGGNVGCGDGNGRGQATVTYEQHEERMAQRLGKMSTVLALSEAQQTQIKALFEQKWQNRQGKREEMQAARKAMHEARTATPFDEVDFRVKATKQNELKTDRMVERTKMKTELYALLTPDQQEKADTVQGMMGGRGNGRHGGGKDFRF